MTSVSQSARRKTLAQQPWEPKTKSTLTKSSRAKRRNSKRSSLGPVPHCEGRPVWVTCTIKGLARARDQARPRVLKAKTEHWTLRISVEPALCMAPLPVSCMTSKWAVSLTFVENFLPARDFSFFFEQIIETQPEKLDVSSKHIISLQRNHRQNCRRKQKKRKRSKKKIHFSNTYGIKLSTCSSPRCPSS